MSARNPYSRGGSGPDPREPYSRGGSGPDPRDRGFDARGPGPDARGGPLERGSGDERSGSAGDPLRRLSGLLARLPGIGEKSAMRLALAMVKADPDYLKALADAIGTVHAQLKLCRVCCDFTSDELCPRCADARRDHTTICVVAQPQDRMAIERTGVFRGVYHVLHGVLDPLGGVGPAELRIDALLARLHDDPTRAPVEEIIVATSPNVEGDATALYLSKLIGPLGVRVSRIASGVAVGGELEYADVTTLHRALEDRRRL